LSEENGFKRSRRFRIAAAAIVSAGLLVPLAVFGGTGFAQSGSPAQVQYKITICHHTHSKKHPTVTISISNRAWPAHQKHGDTLGACPAPKHSKHKGKANGHSKHNGQSQSPNKGQSNGKGSGNGQSKGHGK
jgi:hypothetical protein